MSQTNAIAAFLGVGFIVYIIARGQFFDYLDVVGISRKKV